MLQWSLTNSQLRLADCVVELCSSSAPVKQVVYSFVSYICNCRKTAIGTVKVGNYAGPTTVVERYCGRPGVCGVIYVLTMDNPFMDYCRVAPSTDWRISKSVSNSHFNRHLCRLSDCSSTNMICCNIFLYSAQVLVARNDLSKTMLLTFVNIINTL